VSKSSHLQLCIDEEVLGLEVAMCDTLFVECGDGGYNLVEDVLDCALREEFVS
jgi:hypothetical protein